MKVNPAESASAHHAWPSSQSPHGTTTGLSREHHAAMDGLIAKTGHHHGKAENHTAPHASKNHAGAAHAAGHQGPTAGAPFVGAAAAAGAGVGVASVATEVAAAFAKAHGPGAVTGKGKTPPTSAADDLANQIKKSNAAMQATLDAAEADMQKKEEHRRSGKNYGFGG